MSLLMPKRCLTVLPGASILSIRRHPFILVNVSSSERGPRGQLPKSSPREVQPGKASDDLDLKTTMNMDAIKVETRMATKARTRTTTKVRSERLTLH